MPAQPADVQLSLLGIRRKQKSKNGTNTGHEWQAMTEHKDPLMCPLGYLADLAILSNDHLFSGMIANTDRVHRSWWKERMFAVSLPGIEPVSDTYINRMFADLWQTAEETAALSVEGALKFEQKQAALHLLRSRGENILSIGRCPTHEKDMIGGWSTDAEGSVLGQNSIQENQQPALWYLQQSLLDGHGSTAGHEVAVLDKQTEWKSMLFPHLEEAMTVIAGRKIQLLKDRQALLGKRKRSHHGPQLVIDTLVTDAWSCLQWHDNAVSIFLKNLSFKMHEYGQKFSAYHGSRAVQQIWAHPVYQRYAAQVHKESEAWFREANRPAIDREQGTEQR
ncbi:TPA: hypothetical protein ACH3X1_003076 [Trebouxia sp. C0004]